MLEGAFVVARFYATVRHVVGVESGLQLVVELSGKVIIDRSDIVMRDALSELIEAGEKRILVDMKHVSYMDSAGLGELVACHRRAEELGCSLKILNPSEKITTLLEVMHIEEVFETFYNEEDALNSF